VRVAREACAVKFVVVRDNMDEGVAAGGAFLSLCACTDHPGCALSLHTRFGALLLESYCNHIICHPHRDHDYSYSKRMAQLHLK
jgi:hypothetical protein